jgi:hypothetical protein
VAADGVVDMKCSLFSSNLCAIVLFNAHERQYRSWGDRDLRWHQGQSTYKQKRINELRASASYEKKGTRAQRSRAVPFHK